METDKPTAAKFLLIFTAKAAPAEEDNEVSADDALMNPIEEQANEESDEEDEGDEPEEDVVEGDVVEGDLSEPAESGSSRGN